MSEHPCENCGLPVTTKLRHHELFRCAELLKAQLAAIRAAFPEGHRWISRRTTANISAIEERSWGRRRHRKSLRVRRRQRNETQTP